MSSDPRELVRISRKYQRRLREMELARDARLLAAWLEIERVLRVRAEALAFRVALGPSVKSWSPALVLREQRYRELIAEAREQVERFAGTAAVIVAPDKALAGGAMAAESVRETLAVAGSFTGLPTRAVSAFEDWTRADTMPLRKLFIKHFPEAADDMTAALFTAIGTGKGPAKIAGEMMDAFGIGLDRALTISRTEVMRAHRQGTQEGYRESGVISGYKRLATHDHRVCLGCLFEEGQIFENDRDFDAHPNCRCTTVPIVMGVDAPRWSAGEAWFLQQSPQRQRELLGPTRYKMWTDGEVRDLRRFATHKHDPEWGGAFVPRTIRDLKAAA